MTIPVATPLQQLELRRTRSLREGRGGNNISRPRVHPGHGTSGRTCAHDEFALVMAGQVEVRLVKLATPAVEASKEGSVALAGEPNGQKMGRVIGTQGHMILLPANAAYQFHAAEPSVILLQTIKGDDTIERWAEICLS